MNSNEINLGKSLDKFSISIDYIIRNSMINGYVKDSINDSVRGVRGSVDRSIFGIFIITHSNINGAHMEIH